MCALQAFKPCVTCILQAACKNNLCLIYKHGIMLPTAYNLYRHMLVKYLPETMGSRLGDVPDEKLKTTTI